MENMKISIGRTKVKPYTFDSNTTATTLNGLGIRADDVAIKQVVEAAKLYPQAYGLDAAPASITQGSVFNVVQFFQKWLTEAVYIITRARKIDELVGRNIEGTWIQEEVVQPVVERGGQARPYSDVSDTNLASFNANYETRTIVRGELDVMGTELEMRRAAEMRLNSLGIKREAAAQGLAIMNNGIGFYGYNNGANKTFGLLNDPSLPSYVVAANGTSGDTTWASKTYKEITADFVSAFKGLRAQSGANIDPMSDRLVIGIAVSCFDYLNTANELGKTVREWLKENYPNTTLVPVPEFDGADGGENVMYIIADQVAGQKTVSQNVQDTLRLVGVEYKAKGIVECYSCATAGVMVRVPVGIYRMSGI